VSSYYISILRDLDIFAFMMFIALTCGLKMLISAREGT
jgi:hypothetical protein